MLTSVIGRFLLEWHFSTYPFWHTDAAGGGVHPIVNVDRRHKLIRRYTVTDAAVHDSQVIDDVLDDDNMASDVWADSAYRSAEIEQKLDDRGLKSRIHRKGRRNRPLSKREKQGNTTRSKVRARVEHVFGAQTNDMGGTLVRSIGIARARARIGLKNLAYNMRRAVQLKGLAAARGPT
jgi:IS5 family transposase